MAERHHSGVLDTCTYIDLGVLDPAVLPAVPEITAVTTLPFDCDAASRYGSLVALVAAAGRSPKPRRLDLMVAAIASTRGLPLYTRNVDDFAGLESLVEVVAV